MVGDTHEPEAGVAAPSARGGGGKKRGASDGGGGGKRHKRSTMELLGGGPAASSGSDMASLGDLQPLAAPGRADAPAPEQRQAVAEGERQGGAAALPGGMLGQQASPSKVLDTYAAFNLAAAAPGAGVGAAAWTLPPPTTAAPQLEIPGLRINAKPSSLLPPPAQAGPLPELPPLDTTSPLATAAGLNPFTFGTAAPPGGIAHLDGLTLQQQQVRPGWGTCRVAHAAGGLLKELKRGCCRCPLVSAHRSPCSASPCRR